MTQFKSNTNSDSQEQNPGTHNSSESSEIHAALEKKDKRLNDDTEHKLKNAVFGIVVQCGCAKLAIDSNNLEETRLCLDMIDSAAKSINASIMDLPAIESCEAERHST